MKKNILDIAIEITKEGDIRIENWPDYAMSVDELIEKLGKMTIELQQMKTGKG